MAFLGHIKGSHPNHPWANGPKITFRPKPEPDPKATPKPPKRSATKRKD